MYIQKISIKNYRCFRDFSMEFQKGLNVIIGTNNSGKTGLLYAIGLIIMAPAILKRPKKKLQKFLTFGLSALNGQATRLVRKPVGKLTHLLRIKAIRFQ